MSAGNPSSVPPFPFWIALPDPGPACLSPPGRGEHAHAGLRRERFGEHAQAGFTIIELLVVLAVVGIVAAIGLPSFSTYTAQLKMAGTVGDMSSDLYLARSEAIKRNARVLVCPRASSTSTVCATTVAATTWMNGWLVCYDTDASGACDTSTSSDPNPIRIRSALSSPVSLTGPAAAVTFFPVGSANAAATFTMTSTATSGTRTAKVAPSGSVTTSKS